MVEDLRAMSAVNLLSSLREKPTDENPDDGSNPDDTTKGLHDTFDWAWVVGSQASYKSDCVTRSLRQPLPSCVQGLISQGGSRPFGFGPFAPIVHNAI
ncbi:hypothetical protein HW555_010168 [Spodoptera exigua]|uniref:Uncharacterized protein n=1 Tax=Spodoptera exigua TaxID=7107 RepID=A0A835L1T2_SPOEX|nr:hypothetical protein HW555_010168 [Spodoptera exigua]